MGTPIRDALANVYRASRTYRQAADERDTAVCDALLAGATLRSIARESNMSVHWVQDTAKRGGIIPVGPRTAPTWVQRTTPMR